MGFVVIVAMLIGICIGLLLSEHLNDIKGKNARIEHLERELYKRETGNTPPSVEK